MATQQRIPIHNFYRHNLMDNVRLFFPSNVFIKLFTYEHSNNNKTTTTTLYTIYISHAPDQCNDSMTQVKS